jgi:hypothetical protein
MSVVLLVIDRGGLFATSCEWSTTFYEPIFCARFAPDFLNVKKTHKTAEPRSSYEIPENQARPIPGEQERPILDGESGAFIARLKEVIGEESVLSFSKRCGVKEATLRSYINDGRAVPVLKAAAISAAGGVLVDWLATGRPPKTRADLKASQEGAGELNLNRLLLALMMTEDAAAAVVEPFSAERRAVLTLAFYKRLTGDRHEPK